ncbi:MAG: glycoside hydrolase family 65 protein [Gammaproteobacteria bacterium]|jgi:alpha,alpha-trehalase|nr:glycoside hydrolase family 65 protein [Gammaproteobacteria bacterium]
MDSAWLLSYNGYNPEQEGLRETLCALGNGYFCSRGAAPDASDDEVHYPGTYLAGGYNRLTTEIKGHEVESEDLVNLPNWLVLEIAIDNNNWLHPDQLEFLDYSQQLDVANGMLIRTLRFRDGNGRTTRWRERRLVSMADQHLAGLEIEIEPEDWSGELYIRSALDGTVINNGVARYRELNSRHLETINSGQSNDETIWLMSRTVQSRIEIAEAARTQVFIHDEPADVQRRTVTQPDVIEQQLHLHVEAHQCIRVEKIVALFTSLDHAVNEPEVMAQQRLSEVGNFEKLADSHCLAWKHLWGMFDLRLDIQDGDNDQLKLRLHIFHLLQTVSRHTIDRDVGVPPRGWHGEAYRAHIMWDELFIFPFLNLRHPVLTRALLRYRYRRLPAARRLAQEAGYSGAMFPWQSGSTGREESQKLHLNPQSGRWIPDNSNRQRHISSAVAYNVWQYYQVTDDHEFLYDYGVEMLIEIARFWASITTYNEQIDRYEIRGVMGPDEFHTAYPDADPEQEGGLNNNAYTNILAAWVLCRARDALDLLPPDHERALREGHGITTQEVEEWDVISRKLYVPFHDDGIISQFEGYEQLEEFDWEGYREKYGDIQRLDRLLEAEGDTPNRYKASKQADVLMLFYLFSADDLQQILEQLGYPFDRDTIPKNIEYYLQRTSDGSTLSKIVHSWVLARSDRPRSWQLFQGALNSDINDIQGGTTPEGIHLGAMAGTVDLMQRAYTGIETRGGVLYFNPALPDHLQRLTTRIRYRRQELDLEITRDILRISSRQLTASPIMIAYRGRFREVSPGSVYEFHLIRPEERERG